MQFDSKDSLLLFDKFNKLLALKLTDQFSSDFKVSFSMKEYESTIHAYENCLKTVPSFSFIGQFNYSNRGVLLAVDPQIIYALTQSCFGVDPDQLTQKSESYFNFSEQFIGKEFISVLLSYFEEKACSIQLGRIDDQLDQIHLFFLDEQVVHVTMHCYIQGKEAGAIQLIYPLQFMKKEQDKWLSINEVKQ